MGASPLAFSLSRRMVITTGLSMMLLITYLIIVWPLDGGLPTTAHLLGKLKSSSSDYLSPGSQTDTDSTNPYPNLSNPHRPASHSPSAVNPHREAYVTFLSSAENHWYPLSTRLLLFQLKHDPITRDLDRDFIIITTPRIPSSLEHQLRSEGGIVVRHDMLKGLPSLYEDQPDHPWHDQYTKLHIFNLTSYDRVLYLDSDQLILHPIQEIWEDENSWADSGLSSCADVGGTDHSIPVDDGDGFNAGLMMVRPGARRFEELLQVKDYDATFMEQALLNKYFNRGGEHPWRPLDHKFVSSFPTMRDVKYGIKIIHEKMWQADYRDIDRGLTELWRQKVGRMEGYWIARDEVRLVDERAAPPHPPPPPRFGDISFGEERGRE